MSCSCGNEPDYLECCGNFIENNVPAPTPEALMRSRYSAYTRGNITYIAETMLPPAAIDFDANRAKKWARQCDWQGLEVKRVEQKLNTGYVEFIARYKLNGKQECLHEISKFHYEQGRWYYVDGKKIIS